tara:strand:- start:111 stop:455 length:345 start_codon:yes stop_codon:yes gene_type:complete
MCGNKFDGVFHKKTDEILEKEDFIRRIKTAKMLCQGDTLGDLTTRSGNTPLFRVKISGREYKVHADTTIEAIKEFYKNRVNNWIQCKGANGKAEVLTNSKSGKYIRGFYVYLKK